MRTVGYWIKTTSEPVFDPAQFNNIISAIRQPIHLVVNHRGDSIGLSLDGTISSQKNADSDCYALAGTLPALYPEWLGDRSFQETHKVRYAYVGGAMAHGISSSDLVIELARCGALGFLGAGGMELSWIKEEAHRIRSALQPAGLSWGVNLMHNPADLDAEMSTVEVLMECGVRCISAAAFIRISPALVYFACKGLRRNGDGSAMRQNHIFGKVSRPEVAEGFLSPPPAEILDALVSRGKITPDESELARHLPLAGDITIEADSAGHTDNRPLNVLFPVIEAIRDKSFIHHGYAVPVRLGAAGGISTPSAVSAAFAMGAAYVTVGTAHQTCVEAGTSSQAKSMLADADITDVTMAPSAALFEQNGRVQVLKRGTLMGVRGNRLLRLYSEYNSADEIPLQVREQLEKDTFCQSLDAVWEKTRDYYAGHDPAQIEKALSDGKHKMALLFRWYLGNSSSWAVAGDTDRILDYQIWCGPAIGSFNEWIQDSFLSVYENRRVKQVALNLLEGGARVTRAHQLRTFGVCVPDSMFYSKPIPLR